MGARQLNSDLWQFWSRQSENCSVWSAGMSFFRDREGVCEPVCQGGAVKSIRIIYLQNIEDRIQSSVVAGLRLERKIFALILDSELIRVWKLYQNTNSVVGTAGKLIDGSGVEGVTAKSPAWN